MLNKKIKLDDLFISADDSLLKALEVIDKAGSEATQIALVVDKNQKLISIINDGDIRRALLKNASLNDSVSKYMKENFKHINENGSRAKALQIMKSFSVSQLPVLNDNGNVVGMHFIQDFINNKPLNNVVVIMAGGKGTRLRPLTNDIPKPMIKVAGTPILEHIVHHLVGYGVKNFFLTVNYKADIIKNYFGNGEFFGCSINYLTEEKPMGTAGALSMLPRTGQDIILMNGDLITQFNISKMIELHENRKNHITVGARDHIQTVPYGVLKVSKDSVTEIIEKPERHYLVNGGVYILNPEILDIIPKDKFYYATDLIDKCIFLNKKVGYYLLDEDWIDVGEHSQLNKARGI
jgi:dTDP-glucose pyrophosphorylase/CBS domain-containing protein